MAAKHHPLLGVYLVRAIELCKSATSTNDYFDVIKAISPVTLSLLKIFQKNGSSTDIEERYVSIARAIYSEDDIRKLESFTHHLLYSRADETAKKLIVQTADALVDGLNNGFITIDFDGQLRDYLAPGSEWITNFGPVVDAPRRRP